MFLIRFYNNCQAKTATYARDIHAYLHYTQFNKGDWQNTIIDIIPCVCMKQVAQTYILITIIIIIHVNEELDSYCNQSTPKDKLKLLITNNNIIKK